MANMDAVKLIVFVVHVFCLYPKTVDSWIFSIHCKYYECCDNYWIPANVAELSSAIESKVYGQHLVHGPVLQHVKAHVERPPSKALVLSFHGSPGTGKNHVSRLIVESMFRNGMNSAYVHLFSAVKDFPHAHKIWHYQENLRNLIEAGVRACPRSVFIFDEMHEMPMGLIDTIKPYVDFHEKLGGDDYRRATFIFLSNTGGDVISKATIELWRRDVEREHIPLKDMEELIRKSTIQSNSGWYRSDLVNNNLITAHIPFLPLERIHVEKCIRDALVTKRHYRHSRDVPLGKVMEIADELTYYPEDLKVFSNSGCKRIHQKMDLVMEHIHGEL